MVPKKALAFINNKGERSALVIKNVIASFFIKGLNVAVSLLYVPITLHYLNTTRYGIWMTVTSVVGWIGIMDVGLGNGMRNKLAEALATNERIIARKYVSTSYALLTIMAILFITIFSAVNRWIDWTWVLNTNVDYKKELSILTFVIFNLFSVQFVMKLIAIVYAADQRPAIGGLMDLTGNTLGLIIVWYLTATNQASLVTFGICIMLAPLTVYILASLIAFNGKYKFLKPSFKFVEFNYAKDLTNLGVKFFVIQIAFLFVFETSNILIAHLFSPSEVTNYNITFKYYNILTMVWSMIMAPLWSAFTHAKAQDDVGWMNNIISKLNKSMLLSALLVIIMAIFADYIIELWTSGKVKVAPTMSIIFAFYVLISMWNNIYALFLNGNGNVRIQIYTAVAAAALHIPLTLLLVKGLNMGSEGVVLSMAVSLSFFAIAGPIETFKILRNWKTN